MNNVKKTIGWADFTWNPITGCKRSCEYCYARKIHGRFNKTPFNIIVNHEDRYTQPNNVKKSSKIFVGSMSDIQFWENWQTQTVVNRCCIYDWHTFMFLSKSPSSYLWQHNHYGWPKNTMQGLTVEIPSNGMLKQTIKDVSKYPRPFLSIEPIAGGLYDELPESIELVIVGAETGNRKDKIIPRREWIRSIKDHVSEDKIYWKKNIKGYL